MCCCSPPASPRSPGGSGLDLRKSYPPPWRDHPIMIFFGAEMLRMILPRTEDLDVPSARSPAALPAPQRRGRQPVQHRRTAASSQHQRGEGLAVAVPCHCRAVASPKKWDPHSSGCQARQWEGCLASVRRLAQGCGTGSCGERHEWNPLPQNLTRRGGEECHCPKCKEGQSGSQFCLCQSVGRSLRLSAEWANNRDPLTVALGNSQLHWRWECQTCAHRWSTSPQHRKTSGSPVCAQKKRVVSCREAKARRRDFRD